VYYIYGEIGVLKFCHFSFYQIKTSPNPICREVMNKYLVACSYNSQCMCTV